MVNTELASAKAADKAVAPEDHTITLSTGVVLRGKQVPPLLLVKMMAANPRPKVPVYMNKTMGREMENPDDPDYIDRIKSWKVETSNITINALLLLGTELVSFPKKMPGPDNDAWLEEYQLLGLPMFPGNKSWRYLTWLTYKAAPAASDLKVVKEVVGRLSGVPESSVASAEEFPGGN